MKFSILILFLIYFENIHCLEESLSTTKKKHLKTNKELKKTDNTDISDQIENTLLPKVEGEELPDVPIYHRGWLKYFHYKDDKGVNKPKSFFRNDAFYVQKKYLPKREINKTDSYGYINIPNEHYFYAIVLRDTLNILSSRKNKLMMTIDILNIDFIKPIPDVDQFKGGVRDFGSFNEGYCFKVLTINPLSMFKMNIKDPAPKKGTNEIWMFCTDKKEDKNKFMTALIKLKLKKQHLLGHFLDVKTDPQVDKANDVDYTEGYVQVKNMTDGYWMILQDWSQCTKKCGGGLSYQHLMCIPPKNGGKNCVGQPIRTRPCNTQPCPTVKVLQEIKKKEDEIMLKPIVKMMRISKRPSRYDKCVIKESDALIVKDDPEVLDFEGKPRIPVRLVMNNKTLTIFQDESYKTHLASFLLENTMFKRIRNNNKCFILFSNNNKVELCKLESSTVNFVEEWDYDFNLFKIQCKTSRPEIQLTQKDETDMQKEFKEKIAEAKLDLIRERTNKIKKESEKKEELVLENKVKKVETVTLEAVRKELALERLLEREEQQKEEEEMNELAQQVEIEKKKDQCLIKAIKQKEMEDQYNLAKIETERRIQQLKDDAKKQIIIKRNELKNKILMMRKRQQRKKNMLKQQVLNLRTQMALDLQKLTREGSKERCRVNKKDTNKIYAYCENNFFEDYFKLNECNQPESFCYMCCENEFGEAHIAKRDDCYNMCDERDKTQNDETGRWKWETDN